MKQLFYFGCIKDKGHYLWQNDHSKLYNPPNIPCVNPSILKFIDGSFTPGNTKEQGACLECIIPPLIILAWHDYTVDERQASNSALIGYGYRSAEEMFEDATKQFPSVMSRQPKPVIQKL